METRLVTHIGVEGKGRIRKTKCYYLLSPTFWSAVGGSCSLEWI